MTKRKVISLVPLLLLLVGLADLSAQAFFTTKTAGAFQVRFSSNAGGVQVAIDNQPAGIIPLTVWVLPGVHQFTFTAPGQPAKTIPYPVNGDVDVPFMFTPQTFPLTVNTNVPGAALAVDGKTFAGNTVALAAGAHTLTVSAPGYQPLSLPFQQPANANTLNVTLVAANFPLTVNTNVPGAALALDGKPFAGNTITIAPGAHTLSVSAPGYQPLSLPFQQPANANTLNVTLVAATFPLTVNTNVPGAALAVDGQPFAGNTIAIAPGAHTLTVNAPGYQPLSLPFQQPANANTLNVTLVAATFPLTVNTNVPGAAFSLDGRPFAGNTVSVTAGNHTLSVSAPGYQTMALPFVQPSNPNTLNVTLVALKATLTVNTDKLFRAGTPFNLYVDNVDTRGPVLSLTPGAHTLRIVSGTLSIETSISLNAGQSMTIIPSVQWELR